MLNAKPVKLIFENNLHCFNNNRTAYQCSPLRSYFPLTGCCIFPSCIDEPIVLPEVQRSVAAGSGVATVAVSSFLTSVLLLLLLRWRSANPSCDYKSAQFGPKNKRWVPLAPCITNKLKWQWSTGHLKAVSNPTAGHWKETDLFFLKKIRTGKLCMWRTGMNFFKKLW